MTIEFSLIVPVYDEFARLLLGFKEITDYLLKEKRSWELIIVDDGSPTPAETVLLQSSELRKKVKLLMTKRKLRFVRLNKNVGKGKAIATGVNEAKGKIILFMDVDCSVSPKRIPEFLSALKTAPIAIASRRVPGSEFVIRQWFLREWGGRVYTTLSNSVCRVDVHDATCGFKAFRKDIAKELFSKLKVNRWSFDSEVLFMARKKGIPVKEVPIAWTNKTGSRVQWFGMAQSFFDLLAIRIYDMQGAYQ